MVLKIFAPRICCLALLPLGEAFALGTGAAVATQTLALTRQAYMLEAYDLMPVVECLKGDNMDAVQSCMDNIAPWMEVNSEGGLALSLNAVNGFIGGSVGVMGTVAATVVKKNQVKDRLKCIYCDGTGQIVCGHCLGTRVLDIAALDGSMSKSLCQNCEGTATIVCINCQGSGLSVPDEFLQVLGDDELGFTEGDYIGLFDEASANVGIKMPTLDSTRAGKAEQKATGAPGGPVAVNEFDDPTGGLG